MKKELLIFAVFSLLFAGCNNPLMEKILGSDKKDGEKPGVYYTVTFNSMGGSEVPSQRVAEGGTATRPNNPTRFGHRFMNWYSTDSFTEPRYDFIYTPITADITLYVKWIDKSDPVLLDLAAILQTMTPGPIEFNVFGGILSPGGAVGTTGADYTIIEEGGINKLKVDEFAMWGPGFDIMNLEVGDSVVVKGKYLGCTDDPSNGIQIITNSSGDWDYSTIIRLDLSANQSFNETFFITTGNGDIKIRTNGMYPWASPGGNDHISGYCNSFVIEQVMVTMSN
ncbi:MAG: InlB B-repeat-containing protein [Treponema sp.]|jgi:uncharacterized repeat protein (TIGR02543 family)|nr:InlB B-repeat-containing protein [Treponema sp.]